MKLSFWKYEGLGNDFVIVEAPPLAPEMVAAICDRHRGVGADGVLFVEGGSMRVLNSDGSASEMCGNGLRCVAFHLVHQGVHSMAQSFVVSTDAGPHGCAVLDIDRQEARVTIEMRPASLEPARVPVHADGPLVDALFDLDGEELHGTAVSMGNPHFVLFDEVGERRLELGPRLGRDSRFPEGVNVGFARSDDEGRLVLHVFERGAGWTQACGTGACAAAVAAVETGRRRRGEPVVVRLPGGDLEITVGAPDAPIRMTGPAKRVFEGQLELP